MRPIRLLAVVAPVLLVTVVGGSCGSGESWHNVSIDRVGFAHDRTVVWAQTSEYKSGSCHDIRLDLDRDDDVWRVGVQVKRTEDFCTMEAVIGDLPESATDVVVASGVDDEPTIGHNLVELDLPDPAPDGVTLAIH